MANAPSDRASNGQVTANFQNYPDDSLIKVSDTTPLIIVTDADHHRPIARVRPFSIEGVELGSSDAGDMALIMEEARASRARHLLRVRANNARNSALSTSMAPPTSTIVPVTNTSAPTSSFTMGFPRPVGRGLLQPSISQGRGSAFALSPTPARPRTPVGRGRAALLAYYSALSQDPSPGQQ